MIYRTTPMQVRGTDSYGSGAFGAPRGGRAHNGIDLVCEEGDLIHSNVVGTVSKIGWPYDPKGPKGHKRYIQVTATDGKMHRFFYVHPIAKVGDKVKPGDVLGEAQGLQDIYPGITEHVHYEIKLPTGGFEDPTTRIEN